jgi:fatty-acid peroxygenase
MRDDTIPLLRTGYPYLASRRTALGQEVVPLRLLGRRAAAVCGPEWAQRFYDEDLFERSKALPEPVRSTLVGAGAVHTLDGAAHRHRKHLFVSLLEGPGLDDLVAAVGRAWDRAVPRWQDEGEIVVLDATAEVLLEGVWEWVGLDPAGIDTPRVAHDLLAMVDGFGSLGPRHLRGRRARKRGEAHLMRVVEDVRVGRRQVPTGSPVERVAQHVDLDGRALPPEVAAVELLNIVRPTVAISWFLAFATHALVHHPVHRQALADRDPEQVRAFGHEVRRFYPFAPFMGAVAKRAMTWQGVEIRPGDLVLLDLYGQDHSPELWGDPEIFRPERFLGRDLDPWTLVPQGAGRPESGHRCPGEPGVVLLLDDLLARLAALPWTAPPQDDLISLTRIPSRPASGMRIRVGGT